MYDRTRSAQKKNEQLNASKRLIEGQEDEILVGVIGRFRIKYSS